jgi:hypothetical protein
MKKLLISMLLTLVILLSGCSKQEAIYNFEPRRVGTLFGPDGTVLIEYRTDLNGKLVELNIDRLLTVEEMLLNPLIDYDISVEGVEGDIFTRPSGRCTAISNDLLIPINLEIGNTKYKYDDALCKYKTVDGSNQFRPGFDTEYYLTSYIQEKIDTPIAIIAYRPDETVRFIEVMELPHTVKTLGVYSVLVDEDRLNIVKDVRNYYNDIGIYEQLYLKHQENESALDEINGISATVNLFDIGDLAQVNPLVEDFENRYSDEINAIELLQETIGVNFTTETTQTPDEGMSGT